MNQEIAGMSWPAVIMFPVSKHGNGSDNKEMWLPECRYFYWEQLRRVMEKV